jgi:hypothetical protein
MQAGLEVMAMLPSAKLDECADDVETEPGSVTLGSSGGSWDRLDDVNQDNLEDEIDTTLVPAEADSVSEKKTDEIAVEELCEVVETMVLLPQGRPAGCPVDPCRIFLSIASMEASRKIRTSRLPTLPTIPEEQLICTPTPHRPLWKRFLCCFGSFGRSQDESPAFEPPAPMRRTKSSSADLAALGVSAFTEAECHTLGHF